MTDAFERLRHALADHYRIERELGAGGMATVYLAEDVKHDRKVAVKVLRPEIAAALGAERFLREIKTTASLQHPNILPLFDSGEADGSLFYVMPFVEGETLRDKLNRETQLGIEEAVRLACEIADALDYAHRHQVVHRDIKPENILLHDGRPAVADFGIALAVTRAGGTRLTETGMSIGTPSYMSPEQAAGESEISPRSDIYALGCVLYEMLVGEPPFTGPTTQAIVARILSEEPRSLAAGRPRVADHIVSTVHTALAKLPADRFATASDFRDAVLRRTDGGLHVGHAARGRGSRPLTWWTAVMVLGIVGGWGWMRSAWQEAPDPTRQFVTLGSGLRPARDVPAMALSPDGTQFVFRDDSAVGRLWVKHRGRLEATPIAGSEGATYPVFSPDGESIAFIAESRLQRVTPTTGEVQTLADFVATGYSGLAWLDDGTLAYLGASGDRLEILRVSENGGAARPALRESTLVGGGFGHLVPLPDARGLLLQYCSSGCVTLSIHVLDLRTGERRLLLEDVVQAWYLPNDRLLYVRPDGVALAAPFDLDALAVSGDAVPVLEGVSVNRTLGFVPLTWSPSGTIVYIRDRVGATGNQLVRVDRTGTASPIDTVSRGLVFSVAASRDGSELALSTQMGAGTGIWLTHAEGGEFRRLTFGSSDRRPAWSPDGQRVAFIRDSAGTSAVYARRADGSGNDTLLVRHPRPVQEIDWSPDGEWLLLRLDDNAQSSGDILGVRLVGDQTPVPLVAKPEAFELHPTVSPDGRWLAYASDVSGSNEVYVRPFPNVETAHWQVSTGGGYQPSWNATGTELFFLQDPGDAVMVVPVDTGPTFSAGAPRQLFRIPGLDIDQFQRSFRVLPTEPSLLFLRAEPAGAGPDLVWVDGWLDDLTRRVTRGAN